jgi:hypothetical protein
VNFDVNRSTADQIFCIRQILVKEWDCNDTVHRQCIDFKKDYRSVTREVLYNIFFVFGLRVKLVRATKMLLYTEVFLCVLQ